MNTSVCSVQAHCLDSYNLCTIRYRSQQSLLNGLGPLQSWNCAHVCAHHVREPMGGHDVRGGLQSCCCLKHHHLIVLQVPAHVGLSTGRHQLCQMAKVANGHAVEFGNLHVIDVLVAQSGIAGQHLAEDHHLLIRTLWHPMVQLLQQLHRRVSGKVRPILGLQVGLADCCEHQAGYYEVRGVTVTQVWRYQSCRLGQPDWQLQHFAFSQHS
mmetsp:Transcript_4711/g.8156  ORF Transcript_4711/g.8156 Transcript_4711/m.8156 type:complete len:211 (+) Transcript_4711:249-881(+)